MSSNKTVIAVDAMGGDLGPSVVVPGAIEAARQTGAKILLVGNEATLDGELNRLSPSGVDLEIGPCPRSRGHGRKAFGHPAPEEERLHPGRLPPCA